MRPILLGFLTSVYLGAFTSAFQCPIRHIERGTQTQRRECYDRSIGITGCCVGDTCWKTVLSISNCDCTTRCRGWSVFVSVDTNFKFPKNENRFRFPLKEEKRKRGNKKVSEYTEVFNSDTVCHNLKQAVFSVKTNSKSCVILWEELGCAGKSLKLVDGSIADIKNKGFTAIKAISGCDYTLPNSVPIVLYQYNYNTLFTPLFGNTKRFNVVKDECTILDKRWDNRASLIKKENGGCFTFWENGDCTGDSYCDCGAYDVSLVTLKMNNNKTSWNNKISSLSLCNYNNV